VQSAAKSGRAQSSTWRCGQPGPTECVLRRRLAAGEGTTCARQRGSCGGHSLCHERREPVQQADRADARTAPAGSRPWRLGRSPPRCRRARDPPPGDRRRGSSSSASGLPRVSATVCSRARSSSGHGTTESKSSRASLPPKTPRPLTPAARSTRRCAHARRSTPTSTPPTTAAQQTPRSAQRPDPTTARHRPRTQADGPLPPPTTGPVPPTRPRTDPAQLPTQPERGRQGTGLRAGKPLEPFEHRHARLVERGECQLDLGFHPDRARDPEIRRLLDRRVQERRLANPRLTAHDQRPAATRAHALQQTVEHLTFGTPAAQHPGATRDRDAPASGFGAGHRWDADPWQPTSGGSEECYGRAATGARSFPRPDGAGGFEQTRRLAERVGQRRRLPTGMSQAIDACLEPDCGDRPTVGRARGPPRAGHLMLRIEAGEGVVSMGHRPLRVAPMAEHQS
jgi:hypothetical protein